MVVTDKRWSAKSGKAKETVGWSNPRAHTHALNKERVLYWLEKGAQASGTVHNMLIRDGVIKGAKVHVSPNVKKVAEKKEEIEEIEAANNTDSRGEEAK